MQNEAVDDVGAGDGGSAAAADDVDAGSDGDGVGNRENRVVEAQEEGDPEERPSRNLWPDPTAEDTAVEKMPKGCRC